MNDRPKSKFTVMDGIALGGAILLSVGAGMAWLPGGLMAAGALALAYVMIVASNGGKP